MILLLICCPFVHLDSQALKDNATNYVSIVLGAPLVAGGWAGLGFSGPGEMIGSTAVVATLGVTGLPLVRTYYLKAQEQSQVIIDNTRLTLTQPFEAVYNSTIKNVFVAFQVNFATSKAIPNYLLYAQGPASADGSTISVHRGTFMDKLENAQFPVGKFILNPSFLFSARFSVSSIYCHPW